MDSLSRASVRPRDAARSGEAFLAEASTAFLRGTLDPDETLRLLAILATRTLCDFGSVDLLVGDAGIRRVSIAHADPAKEPLVREYARRFPPRPELRRLVASIPPDGEVLLNDLAPDRVEAWVDGGEDELRLIRALGTKHHLMLPLVGRDGAVGAVGFTRSDGPPFAPEEVQLAKGLVARAALAYENALLHAELRASEERLRRLLDTAPVQIITIDVHGTIKSLNRSLRGGDPKAMLHANIYDTIAPHDRARVRDIIEGAIRAGETTEYETEGIVAPGITRWYNVRVAPLQLDGGVGAVLISMDVDERHRAQAELDRLRLQLIHGEKLAALGTLVSGVAHELRTPLTFLANNTFLLQHRLDREARRGASAAQVCEMARPFVADIVLGVDRINQLVEDLRKYTKARQDSELTAAPLEEFIAEAVEIFRATHRASHSVEARLLPTAPVRANKGALQQLVLNLLQNAAEASDPGAIIRIATRMDGRAVVLEVVDHGSGISEEVRGRMFDPLFTTKVDGTGLGLAIVKRIVDEHHATIECESAPGMGATFRVRFPLAA